MKTVRWKPPKNADPQDIITITDTVFCVESIRGLRDVVEIVTEKKDGQHKKYLADANGSTDAARARAYRRRHRKEINRRLRERRHALKLFQKP